MESFGQKAATVRLTAFPQELPEVLWKPGRFMGEKKEMQQLYNSRNLLRPFEPIVHTQAVT